MLHQGGEEIDILADAFDDEGIERVDLPRIPLFVNEDRDGHRPLLVADLHLQRSLRRGEPRDRHAVRRHITASC